jgi:hypothetical protein
MTHRRTQPNVTRLGEFPLEEMGSDSNKDAITNNYHLPPAPFSFDAEEAGIIDTQESKDGPRIDTDLECMGKE